SVAIFEDVAAVGAPLANSSKGEVSVYTATDTGWSDTPTVLRAAVADAAVNDLFGQSVDVGEEEIAVGAPGSNGTKGAAYVFAHSASSWSQQARLTLGTAAAAGDDFGRSVA